MGSLPGVQDNTWHGLCVTWKKENGVYMVYYDGRLLFNGESFKSGNLLSSNGIFTLGIGSSNDRLFSGRLGHVNAWMIVLEHPQLAVLSSKCGVERGELVSWPQFKQGAHSITVFEGETCPFTGKIELFQYAAFLFSFELLRSHIADSGLMVSALDSGSSGPGSSPGRTHCVTFLGKTLYSHNASLHLGVLMGMANLLLGGNYVMDNHPMRWGVRNTPSCFILLKPE